MIRLLARIALTALACGASTLQAAQPAAAGSCDRRCLEGHVDGFLAALGLLRQQLSFLRCQQLDAADLERRKQVRHGQLRIRKGRRPGAAGAASMQ